jgi:hypothetical protein
MTRYGQCPTPAFDITPVLFGKYGIESRPVGHNTSFYSASAVLTDRWRNPFPLQRPRAEFVPPSAVDPWPVKTFEGPSRSPFLVTSLAEAAAGR